MNNEDINIEKELFCLKYELQAFSDAVLFSKAERWVKGFLYKSTEDHHIDRYLIATKYVENKLVLDIACGSGYGTYIIASKGKANKVIGVDLNEDAIQYGNYKYKNDSVERLVGDATNFKYKNKFDVVVSFETIEHIKNYNLFIENLYNNLNYGGLLIISTPINKITTTKLINPYHEIEWSFFDFHDLFLDKFKIKDIYIQKIELEDYDFFNLTFKQRLINFIYKKIKGKLKYVKKPKRIFGKEIELFENQYNMSKCISGYQILILEKML
ncbi:MAG: class I SAM-dependent methyltransferase [Flavobacterium sp.]|nr:class I SAM-dependent methyltransferase [Flavobacterium sp.]